MFSFPRLPFALPSLPSLPNLSVPLNIQRRFLSFLLKQSLGHLVKPGQLDTNQIEAQIGQGWVEIRDIELDEQAINAHLAGLPVRLHGGKVGKITTRIPWPNIFSAPLSLSVHGLDLSFILVPGASASDAAPTDHAATLAEPVTAAAETFIHEELSKPENDALHQSIHLAHAVDLDQGGQINPPGSFAHEEVDEEGTEEAKDLEGVSVLASIVERLLARFSFDARDIRITLIDPREAEFTLRIPEVDYATAEGETDGEQVRTLRINGVSASIKDIFAPRTAPPSPILSASEDDDDLPMHMSQSIACLPTESIYQSMYQSAISAAPRSPVQAKFSAVDSPPGEGPLERLDSEEKVLSIEPIVIRLVTIGLVPAPAAPSDPTKLLLETPDVTFSVELGIIAVAPRARHIQALLRVVSSLPPSPPSSTPAPPPNQPSFLSKIGARLQIRGVVALLLQEPVGDPTQLAQFYEHPATFHALRTSHVRLHLETITVNLTTHSSVSTPSQSPRPISRSLSRQDITASVSDLSLFFITTLRTTSSDSSVSISSSASPILISDPHLLSQYDSESGKMPSFSVADWRGTSGSQPKSAQWKQRPPQGSGKRTSIGAPSSAAGLSASTPGSGSASPPPVVLVKKEIRSRGPSTAVEVDLSTLHFFVDLEVVARLASFGEQIQVPAGRSGGGSGGGASFEATDKTPPVTPRSRAKKLGGMRRVVQGDDGDNDDESAAPSAIAVVRLPLLRVEIRSPTPPVYGSAVRSGAVVIDIHQIRVKVPTPSIESTRFESPSAASSSSLKHIVAEVEWRALFIAAQESKVDGAGTRVLGTKAVGFVSLGPIAPSSTPDQPFDLEVPLHPRICVRTSSVSKSIEIRIPSVRVVLSKSLIDVLQYWADDTAQWAERTFGEPLKRSSSDRTDPSLIGSRFFNKRENSVGSTDTVKGGGKEGGGELAVLLDIAEISVDVLVPRAGKDGSTETRPLTVKALDANVVVEINPQGKSETVVVFSVRELDIADTSASGAPVPIIAMAVPRTLNQGSKYALELQLRSLVISDTSAKESRIKLSTFGLIVTVIPDFSFAADLALFAKAPKGLAFEAVVPTECTRLQIRLVECAIRVFPPTNPGTLVLWIGDTEFATDLIGQSTELTLNLGVKSLSILFVDDASATNTPTPAAGERISASQLEYWKRSGFAHLLEVTDLDMQVYRGELVKVAVDRAKLAIHLAADSISGVAAFGADFASLFPQPEPAPPPNPESFFPQKEKNLFASMDEEAFRKEPELDSGADLVRDDVPRNMDYLDASFGAAAGLTVLPDEFDEDDNFASPVGPTVKEGLISDLNGETIRMLGVNGFDIVEDYFESIKPDDTYDVFNIGSISLCIRARDCDVNLLLYDGYDWVRTQKTIESEIKTMRRRLAKIRQLLATGQTPDETVEETHAVLFNSVYIGLPPEADELEPAALIMAIDEELDDEMDTASRSSWQTFNQPHQPGPQSVPGRTKRLARSRGPQVEFCLHGLKAEVDQLLPKEPVASRVLVTVHELEILDHIKTSTWKKFLTELRSDTKGNVRETDSNMVRVELQNVRPIRGQSVEEGRFRMKLLPLRLHVDQDALDFLKKFFAFADSPAAPPSAPPSSAPKAEPFFQYVEVFPVDIKLDFKPKRVDYRALRQGRTIELMNFFHFEGAEMTLRHITMSGVTGWPRLFDTLNDLWTPDVKANQLADVISGIAPIRSVVNVGSGVADLVLLPIAQYRKDGRIMRGVQKGTTSFVKSTAMEAIKLVARLATGTQVILEQAEWVLGGEGFKEMTTEIVGGPGVLLGEGEGEDETEDLISKYADQPGDVTEGIKSAYKSLSRNINSAAQTILAVPMEVYERAGNEGPVRAVVRAVPIAVLKPMIGASEAVSKTMLGLRNTLDPDLQRENDEKYKRFRR
ncbi:hypothetical protein BOTBODRAFT_173128 [Botryobasidium botryosum FD-172 SS1]|uniref:Autophagy-related protein 2 n=1 Tax=Botryobasidium botryosum (strain FD-172 SS1) TaxID=930990 RepID=A0A067MKC1_BOTB1|nr:hypothetical protein BOTBODRAFT_173128 [Botryobasidium botryosum FD-172 SS1]